MLFFIGWFFWLYGVWREIKAPDLRRRKILLALLPGSVAFLFWPSFTQRIAFILVPWLALSSGFGLAGLKNKYFVTFLLAIYILINYNIDWLMQVVNLSF